MLLLFIDDSRLGRLEYANMTQQALMERVVMQLSAFDMTCFQDGHRNFKDISCWTGVECNAAGDVTSISWSPFSGALDLNWAPETVRILRITEAPDVHGSVDFHCLPRDLVALHIEAGLEGEIRLDKLPKNLVDLQIFETNFTGELIFKNIPDKLMRVGVYDQRISRLDMRTAAEALEQINVSLCGLEGTLDFQDIAPTLLVLRLRDNAFTGTLRFADLPEEIETLHLDGNVFHGTLDLSELPRTLEDIKLGRNKFSQFVLTEDSVYFGKFFAEHCSMSGSVNFDFFPDCAIEIHLGRNYLTGHVSFERFDEMREFTAEKNRFDGELDCTSLPEEMEVFDLSENRLGGNLDLTALPESITRLNLGKNRFSGTVDLNHLPKALALLDLNRNQISGLASLLKIPRAIQIINLYGNKIVAKELVVHSKMRPSGYIDLRENSIEKIVNEKGRSFSLTKIWL